MGQKNLEKKRATWRAWYHRTKHEPKEQRRRRDRRRRKRIEWKARLTAIKVERGCASCGERHPACLDFHHERDKLIEVASVTAFSTWEDIEAEIAKCVVLCANCHLKMHRRRTSRPVPPRMRGKFLDDG